MEKFLHISSSAVYSKESLFAFLYGILNMLEIWHLHQEPKEHEKFKLKKKMWLLAAPNLPHIKFAYFSYYPPCSTLKTVNVVTFHAQKTFYVNTLLFGNTKHTKYLTKYSESFFFFGEKAREPFSFFIFIHQQIWNFFGWMENVKRNINLTK